MNDSELLTYGLVVQAIAIHAFAKAEADPAVVGPVYFHDFVSALEEAASDLVRLGILSPLNDKRGCPYFVFSCEVGKSANVATRNWRKGPTFPELLVTFVNLFGEFGSEYWGFSSKPNDPFGENSKIASTLDALASLGYLTRTGNDYVWADR